MAYGTRRFNGAFTRALQCLSWAESTHILVFPRILILSSYLSLGLPEGLFPVVLSIKMLKALLPSFFLATCPAHFNLSRLNRQYKLRSSSL